MPALTPFDNGLFHHFFHPDTDGNGRAAAKAATALKGDSARIIVILYKVFG